MTLLARLSGLFARGDAAAGALALPGPVAVRRSDSVSNPYTGLGGLFDKGTAARPNLAVVPLQDSELQALYACNGIARRIVDILPSRATRCGWTCPDIPMTEDKRLHSWARCSEAMSMARLYGGSVLLMVTEDDVAPGFRARPYDWLREPLDLERVGALHALQVFDAWEARPVEWDRDIASPGFRMPLLWSMSCDGFAATVHASRVVHFRGARRPPSQTRWGYSNGMPDSSALQAVWDEIRRLTETMQAGAVLAQELRESVLKIGSLASIAVGDEAGALTTRIGLMARTKALLGMVLVGPDDDYENRGNPPTGFNELSEGAMLMLCTALGWPRSMLSGEPPGGLTSDDEGGHERERQLVSDYQEANRSELEQLYTVLYSAQDGPTSGAVPEEWALEFASLDEPTELDQATLRKTVAEMDAIYIGQGVYGPEAVAESRFGAEGWCMDLEEVEIPDPAEEAAIETARMLAEAEMLAAKKGGAPAAPPAAG